MGFIALADRKLDPRQFTAVTVGDERGDTLGMLARRLGGTPHRVDMSGNPVAAGRAVLRVIQAMQAGKQSIIAPDGPDGPAYTAKDGVAYLARKAGANILPLGVFTRSALFLNRWDSYLLPLPFSRFHVVIGPPIGVGRKDDLHDVLQRVSIALHDVRDRAQVLAGIRPWR